MYEAGHKVVHPFYGAGTVTDIQTEVTDTEKHDYYILKTVPNPTSTQVIVPVEGAIEAGLRPVREPEELRRMLAEGCVVPQEDEIEGDFHARQDTMKESLQSGSFERVVNTVKTLFFMSSQRSLSIPDQQILNKGKDSLACELALASESDVEASMQKIDQYLENMLPEEE